jgi:DNA-binding beta-propeller fold protein YncE
MNHALARVALRFSRTQLFSRPVKPGSLKVFAAALACLVGAGAVLAADDAFLPQSVRPVNTVPSTGPSAGDQNPYGVAFVPPGFPSGGPLNPGDILVSNFNAASNLQGSGTTIMDVPAIPPSPQGTAVSIFFQGTAPLGLTTALDILRAGFVLVGNFPSPDGSCGSASAGSILVIDKMGNLSSTISGSAIQGPWDSTLFDQGGKAKFFVANGLSGTVVRLDLAVDPVKGVTVSKTTQIASGYTFMCDPVTFVDAPTGLVYDPRIDVLYVASTADNTVFAVSDAGDRTHDGGTGRVVYTDAKHLHGPLGMAMAPNGHLLVTNNDSINSDPNQPSEIVEFTVGGKFVKEISVDPTQGGSFGLAVQTAGETAKFAAVDDVTSLFLVWTLNLED